MQYALFQDLRLASRRVRKNLKFTALVVLTAAVGIAALTAVFSVVEAVLLEPLPYAEEERLVSVQVSHPEHGANLLSRVSTWQAFEQRSGSLDLAVFSDAQLFVETLSGSVEAGAGLVDAEFFDTLGVRPALGRAFVAGEPLAGTAPALISHRLWREGFGGDPELIGTEISFEGVDLPSALQMADRRLTLVGVLPERYRAPFANLSPDVWIATSFDRVELEADRVILFGRLRPGRPLEQAEQELDAIFQQYQNSPQSLWQMRLVPLRQFLVGDLDKPILYLFWGAALVLLVSIVNTSSLLLAQAHRRAGEAAVRAAIGARRGHILRLCLTEGAVFAALAGVFGLLGAYLMLQLFQSWQLAPLPGRFELKISWPVLAFTAGVLALVTLVLAVVPAWKLSRARAVEISRGGCTHGRASKWYCRCFPLVAVQIAVALLLAIGSALLVRSLGHLHRVDPGFREKGLLTCSLSLPQSLYSSGAERAQFYQEFVRRLTEEAGIAKVGLVNYLPLGGSSGAAEVAIENPAESAPDTSPTVQFRAISPEYLQTMEIDLIEGRYFSTADLRQPAVILSAKAARLLRGDQPALGQRVKLGGAGSRNSWAPVVGVVEDVLHDSLFRGSEPTLYLPFMSPRKMAVVARSQAGDGVPSAALLSRVVQSLDPRLPLADVEPMRNRVLTNLGRVRLSAWLATALAGVTVLLAVIGVYGAVWYTMAENLHEIGIRFALGARRRDIFRHFGGWVMAWTGGGVVVGWVLALAASSYLSSIVFEVSSTDPTTFLAVTATVVLVACWGIYLPTRRAAQIDPSEVIKDR